MTSKEVNVLSDLIFAELAVNEVEKESLSLKQLVKKQSAKTNNIYSNYNEITSGVPHWGFFCSVFQLIINLFSSRQTPFISSLMKKPYLSGEENLWTR